jgi:methanogenic corrinoid protein MtbC1
VTSAGPATAVHDRYLAALVDGRERAAFDVLAAALDGGIPVQTVYLEVVEAALREVGERWARAEMSIAQEHLATAVVQANLARLAPRLRPAGPPPGPPKRIVVATAPGELHSVGARMLADTFDAAGWIVDYLPPPTPVAVLVDHVGSVGPAVVALSTTLPTHLPHTADAVGGLRTLAAPPLLALGGRAFRSDPDLPARLGADVAAPDAFTAVTLVTAALAVRRV